jgi:DNA-binding NtrC family response regulator
LRGWDESLPTSDPEEALRLVQSGACRFMRGGFLPKPLNEVRWKRVLDDVAALYDQRRRVRELEEQLLKDLGFHGIVGKSPVMLEVFDFARKVARHYPTCCWRGPPAPAKSWWPGPFTN